MSHIIEEQFLDYRNDELFLIYCMDILQCFQFRFAIFLKHPRAVGAGGSCGRLGRGKNWGSGRAGQGEVKLGGLEP